MYQCPFGLKLHFYEDELEEITNANLIVSMPFGLKLHFYTDGYQPHYQGYVNVSMPFGLKLHFYAVGNEKIGYQNSTYQCPSG